MEVASPQSSATASLTDVAALKAALASRRPDITSFDITTTSNADASHAVVSLTLATSKGSQQVQAIVERSGATHFGLYPDWRVIVMPALLTITLPHGSNGVTIDGKALAIGAGKSEIAVLPLDHTVVVNSTHLMAEQKITVDTFITGDQTVTYQPKLTTAGTEQAASAVKTYFANVCAKQTGPIPDLATCPQRLGAYLPYTGQWQLIGDPSQGLTVASDADGNIALGGHYQMAFAHSESGIAGTNHEPDGGAFTALVTLSDTQVQVIGIRRSTNAVALDRPAGATDENAKDLVAKALAACASLSAETVADCPQSAPDAGIRNVRWKLNGDPISGATVSFDGKTGLFKVHGNFSMSVSYTWFGDARSRTSYITAYNAYLFWNGQALQLITIEGSPS
jgi:hypothetical protein